MHTSYYCMSCALSSLNNFQGIPLIDDAKKHLKSALLKADAYQQTWHSIYWVAATNQTKKRVREQLNHLAFDAYTELLECFFCINQYVDNVPEKSEPPLWWNDMIISLTLAYDAIEREHEREISVRQLVLFDIYQDLS